MTIRGDESDRARKRDHTQTIRTFLDSLFPGATCREFSAGGSHVFRVQAVMLPDPELVVADDVLEHTDPIPQPGPRDLGGAEARSPNRSDAWPPAHHGTPAARAKTVGSASEEARDMTRWLVVGALVVLPVIADADCAWVRCGPTRRKFRAIVRKLVLGSRVISGTSCGRSPRVPILAKANSTGP